MQLQNAGDLGGNSARIPCHISPVVPKRDDPCFGAGVIPVDVAPTGLGRVHGSPVEFHRNPVLTVVIVEIAGPPAYPADGLALCSRQPMRPFDAANIVPLQYRVDAAVDIGEGSSQLGAPSQSRPGR